MLRVNLLSGINVREWPKALSQSVRTLDWRVGAIAGLAIGALVFIAIRMLRSGHVTQRPLPESAKPQSLPESTKQQFKNADLDFPKEKLLETDSKLTQVSSKPQILNFGDICQFTLRALDTENGLQTGRQIIINSVNSSHILDYLNFGLPAGTLYIGATPTEKANSWLMQILQRLKEKHFIADFEVDTVVKKNYDTDFVWVTNEITIQKIKQRH